MTPLLGRLGWRYLLRLGLGAVFLYAAATKLGHLGAFAEDVHNYRLIPVALENLFAMCLVWVELVVAGALIFNLAPRSSVILTGGLLVVFMVAIGQAVVRNLDIECGCFGTGDARRVGWIAMVQDAGMLAAAVLGYPRR